LLQSGAEIKGVFLPKPSWLTDFRLLKHDKTHFVHSVS